MRTGSPGAGSFKAQLVGFINACQYLRVPLIVANTLVILVKVRRRAPRRGGVGCVRETDPHPARLRVKPAREQT